MTNRLYTFLILTLFLIVSCQSKISPDTSIDGIWESIGYGEMLKIEADNYAFYDITKISCLPVEQGNISAFGNGIEVQNDTLIIAKGIGRYYYKRVDTLPDLCKQQLSDEKKKDPIFNFEVMAHTIEEHFAYFERNNIDWDSLYNKFKEKITIKSSDVELYLVLEEVINALKDNHGDIEPSDKIYEQAERVKQNLEEFRDEEQLEEYGDFQIAQMVAESFLEEEKTEDTWLMHWGTMNNNVGYIQVKSMWLFADLSLSDSLIKENGFIDTYVEVFTEMNESDYIEKERKGIALIMDKVMNDLKETEYIILDVRFNGGGQDAVGMEILRRFNDKRIKVATKKGITKKGYTKKFPIFLESSVVAYTKPVYLLTSQQSASATDFLALASLELRNFKRIGSHSNGALSDALEKRLPNGWHFSISNEIYEDNKGVCYESIGIPVDYELHYPDDRQTFFRGVANDLKGDRLKTLKAIAALREE